MNILEALEVALPDLPARSVQRRYPKLDPRVIAKEHIEQGVAIVLAKMPGSENFVRLTPEQWTLLKLFDGERSFKEIANAILDEAGVPFTEEDVKEFAYFLDKHADLFYKTPLETNITLKQKLSTGRQKRFHIGDITDITLHTWPNADDYLTKLQPHLEFIYTNWFTALTLLMFGVMFWMWTDKFSEIWNDSFAFYNFTAKSAWDLLEFWFLFGAMAFFHESAHGLTCKHFGARVEKMGFILMYFAPTFICDVTQVWVMGGRKARLLTVLAGIWVDLMICVVATFVWWGTATGMSAHDFAYKVMMVTGIGVTVLNLNPLIKLDGYYMFSELVGEADLKERTTLYVSGWIRRHIFGLPAELEYVPRRRRILYVLYALLSGIYSYGLIILVILFLYHVLHVYSPDWAWAPGLLIAYLIFRSRIGTSGRFMKLVYLDKKERFSAWLTPKRITIFVGVLLAVLFAPLWPDFIQGKFVLEPAHQAVIRAQVPGSVVEVLAEEGQSVPVGTPLLRLRNLELESAAARARADLSVLSDRLGLAKLRYANVGPAEYQRQQAAERDRTLNEQVSHLQINSPLAGILVTPRMHDLLGASLEAGTQIAEIADPTTMIAHIYVPEFGMRDVHVSAPVKLQPVSRLMPLSGRLIFVAPVAGPMEAGLIDQAQLQGLNPPRFYAGRVEIRNPGELRPGMSGNAKIFVKRRSVAEFTWRFGRDLVERRFW